MHILLIHQIFDTPNDGGGTRHYELAKYLVDFGHKVTVITGDVNYLENSKRRGGEALIDGIDILYVKINANLHKSLISRAINFFSFSIQAFIRGLSVHNVDVVWTTSPPLFQAFSGLLLAGVKGKPCMFEVRDLWVDFAIQLGILKKGLVVYALKAVEKILYKYSSLIIVNSPGFIPHISKYVDSSKICLVPNGVITDDFLAGKVDREAFRAKYGLKDTFIALYLGNIGIANDIENILRAAKLLEKEDRIKFLVMGGGIGLEKVKAAKNELKNLILLDAVPKKDVLKVLAASDVGLATLKDIPLFGTVYPNKIFDYMAAKKPTVLAIKGVAKDIIDASGGGVFVEPGDSAQLAEAILEYSKAPDRVAADGNAAFVYVKKHFERRKIAESFNNEVLPRLIPKA